VPRKPRSCPRSHCSRRWRGLRGGRDTAHGNPCGHNPWLDVVHSKSLGGAALKGEVLDARLAIDGFAEKLAGACGKLSRQGQAASG
jgi:hypothetical protein